MNRRWRGLVLLVLYLVAVSWLWWVIPYPEPPGASREAQAAARGGPG